jgi:squalene synthase HpnC
VPLETGALPDRAYAACEALARSHYENFPVASRLLPKAMRPHVAAVYAFARVADDIADEGTLAAAERQARLHAWRDRLHDTVAGHAHAEVAELADRRGAACSVETACDVRDDLIVAALAHSIRALDLPLGLFDDLVSAFEQDTMTTRYASWTDLFEYCRRSANPVGRLVLRIAGYRSDTIDRSSDALCTALQLTNFWQDLGRDWRAGRLYVPREVQTAFGADERELNASTLDAAWCAALTDCVRVTRDRFAAGRAVCDAVAGRLRYELRFTWLGGRRILDRTEHGRRDLPTRRPALGARDAAPILWDAVCWSRS